MKPLVVVTRKIPDIGISALQEKGFRVKYHNSKKKLSHKELLKFVKGAHAILCLLDDKVDERVMHAAGTNLKIVANYAVGYDNIDVAAAREKEICVTNTAGSSSLSVAEFSVGLMLTIARDIAEADAFMRKGKYAGWNPWHFLGHEISGKTVGVVGFGRIGQEVAKICKNGFGMKVLVYDAIRNQKAEKEIGVTYAPLGKLLQTSDYVSLHVPLLDSTRHLIGAKELKAMKPTAYLINTARGPVIDEKALVSALRARAIAGAALDVYENEPKLTPGLIKLNNVALTPHIASATEETRNVMAKMAADNIIAVLEGKAPLCPVNSRV